jgi:hypothetical protein
MIDSENPKGLSAFRIRGEACSRHSPCRGGVEGYLISNDGFGMMVDELVDVMIPFDILGFARSCIRNGYFPGTSGWTAVFFEATFGFIAVGWIEYPVQNIEAEYAV